MVTVMALAHRTATDDDEQAAAVLALGRLKSDNVAFRRQIKELKDAQVYGCHRSIERERELQTAKAELTETQQQLADATQAQRTSAEELVVLKNARTTTDQQLTECKRELTDVQQQLTDVQQQLADATQELVVLRNARTTTDQQLTECKRELTDVQQQLADAMQELVVLRNARTTTDQQLTECKRELTDVQQQLADATQELVVLKNARTTTDQQLTECKRELTDVQQQLAAAKRAQRTSAAEVVWTQQLLQDAQDRTAKEQKATKHQQEIGEIYERHISNIKKICSELMEMQQPEAAATHAHQQLKDAWDRTTKQQLVDCRRDLLEMQQQLAAARQLIHACFSTGLAASAALRSSLQLAHKVTLAAGDSARNRRYEELRESLKLKYTQYRLEDKKLQGIKKIYASVNNKGQKRDVTSTAARSSGSQVPGA